MKGWVAGSFALHNHDGSYGGILKISFSLLYRFLLIQIFLRFVGGWIWICSFRVAGFTTRRQKLRLIRRETSEIPLILHPLNIKGMDCLWLLTYHTNI